MAVGRTSDRLCIFIQVLARKKATSGFFIFKEHGGKTNQNQIKESQNEKNDPFPKPPFNGHFFVTHGVCCDS